MYLEELTGDVQLENDRFECKSRLNRDDIVGWMKTVAGFANASGGDFYIGAEDKTNKLTDFGRTEADNERNYFNNQVNEHLVPRPKMTISFIRYENMFKDRLEISSPGSFYRGEKPGKTYDLSGIISKRRNELIANVLVSCNVMEAAGTGFDKIIEEYKGTDESHKPYIYSTSHHFTLVLPDLTYVNGVEDSDAPVLAFVPVPNGTDYDGRVLSFCYYHARKVSEIAASLGISDSTYLRKQVLGNLEKQGYLEKSKISRAMYYKTRPDVVRVE